MSKVWSSPVGVGYPVDFRSGGDTTRDAFGKHIQEIERIYGMLNALDAGKVGASDVSGSIGSVNSSLTAHINSSTPHPNWKPSVSWNDLTNKPSLSALSGNLDASRISGLTSLIDGRIPASGGDGITSGSLGDNGYVKFKNGLIIQWGKTANQFSYVAPNATTTHKFSALEFPEECFVVVCQPCMDGTTGNALETMAHVVSYDKTGFKFIHSKFANSDGGGPRAWFLRYIAIGK